MVVKVYSTPTCPWCAMAKKYLASKNIPFEDIDVTKDKAAVEEMVRKSGQKGGRVIDIAGNIVIGFDQNAIDRLLGT